MNYFIQSANDKYLNIDYDLLYEKVKDIDYEYIELRDTLTLNDYYETDTHWKQQNLKKVVKKLGKTMNFETKWNYKGQCEFGFNFSYN